MRTALGARLGFGVLAIGVVAVTACGGAAPAPKDVTPTSTATNATADDDTDGAAPGASATVSPRTRNGPPRGPASDPLATGGDGDEPVHPAPQAGVSVSGKLPPEVIARVVRSNLGSVRSCYDTALKRDPSLRGTVKIRFVIGKEGHVSSADDEGSQMSAPVVDCVRSVVKKMIFPQPEGGIVTVVYPFVMEPG